MCASPQRFASASLPQLYHELPDERFKREKELWEFQQRYDHLATATILNRQCVARLGQMNTTRFSRKCQHECLGVLWLGIIGDWHWQHHGALAWCKRDSATGRQCVIVTVRSATADCVGQRTRIDGSCLKGNWDMRQPVVLTDAERGCRKTAIQYTQIGQTDRIRIGYILSNNKSPLWRHVA